MGLIRAAARPASLGPCQVDFVPFTGAHEQLLLQRPSDASDRPLGATLDAAAVAAAAAPTHRQLVSSYRSVKASLVLAGFCDYSVSIICQQPCRTSGFVR